MVHAVWKVREEVIKILVGQRVKGSQEIFFLKTARSGKSRKILGILCDNFPEALFLQAY